MQIEGYWIIAVFGKQNVLFMFNIGFTLCDSALDTIQWRIAKLFHHGCISTSYERTSQIHMALQCRSLQNMLLLNEHKKSPASKRYSCLIVNLHVPQSSVTSLLTNP